MKKILQKTLAWTILLGSLYGCGRACSPTEEERKLDTTVPKPEKLEVRASSLCNPLFADEGVYFKANDQARKRTFFFLDKKVDGTLDEVIIQNLYEKTTITNSADLIIWRPIFEEAKKQYLERYCKRASY